MVVDNLRVLYPIKTLCRIFDVHRSSYRYWCRPNVLDVELTVKRSLVSEAWNVSGGSAGARSIAMMVTNTHGVKLGRWLAGKLMKKLNFVSLQTGKHKYKREGDEPVDILLNRQFSVTGPDQVWCGDVTYICVGSRWAYLAVVLDLFARKPVGWAMSFSPDSQLTIRALQMAWELLGHHKQVMFQGSHYTSLQYRQTLWCYKLTQSMSRKGNCWDNSPMERFFPSLKSAAQSAIIRYITHYYSGVRTHWYNAGLTSNESERLFHEQSARVANFS